MLNVLLFTNLYPTPQDPTRGLYNLYNFKALSQYCDTRMVTPLPWWGRWKSPGLLLHTPYDDSTGIPAWYPSFYSLPGAPSLHARGMYVSLRSRLNRLRAEFPFDVILASWAYPDAVAAAHYAHEVGCPLVSMALGSDLNEISRHAALRTQIVDGLRRSECVVAVSGALKEKAISLGIPADRVKVQHNGVDGERFRIRAPEELKAVRERLGLPQDRPVVGFVGNFKPEKGVEVLVAATGALKRRGRADLLLAMVGDGPLLEPLRAEAKALGVEGQILFCGRRSHDEVPDWIAASDVMCLPSFREGCPNVVLESLASGKPVVASRVGGVPELLLPLTEGQSTAGGEDPGPVEVRRNGILVPSGDPEALASGLEAALDRDWVAEDQRNTVEFLSWDQFGLTLYHTLQDAVESWNARRSGG